jgi:hypothetical protein
MKNEILLDYATACGQAPGASLRTAPAVTTRHLSQRR